MSTAKRIESQGSIMLVTKISSIRDRVPAEVLGLAKADRDQSVSRLRWELQQVMSRVRPEDLSSSELSALLLTLRRAHTRVIGRPAIRPVLRLLGSRSEEPTPKLA